MKWLLTCWEIHVTAKSLSREGSPRALVIWSCIANLRVLVPLRLGPLAVRPVQQHNIRMLRTWGLFRKLFYCFSGNWWKTWQLRWWYIGVQIGYLYWICFRSSCFPPAGQLTGNMANTSIAHLFVSFVDLNWDQVYGSYLFGRKLRARHWYENAMYHLPEACVGHTNCSQSTIAK